MRLTPEELQQLPSSFTPAQARAIAGVGDEREVLIAKADGSFVQCKADDPITLSPGDEVELVPPAHSTNALGMRDA